MDWEINSKWTKKGSKYWTEFCCLVWKLFKLWKLFNWKTCLWIQTTLNVQQLLFEFDFSIFRTVFWWKGPFFKRLSLGHVKSLVNISDRKSNFSFIVWLYILINSIYPDGFYSDLNSWEKTALKIIQNDTDIAYDLKNFRIENWLFDFCVGKTGGGNSPEVSNVIYVPRINIGAHQKD